jgi:hypothetical protein
LTHFFDQLPDKKTYRHFMQDYAVVHIAVEYINALDEVFGK